MLTRLGRFTVRRHRLVLSLTVLFMIAAAVVGTRAFGVLQDEGFADPSSESAHAADVLDARFDTAEPNAIVVVTSATGDVDDPATAAAAARLATAIGAVPDVVDVSSYWSLDRPPDLRSTNGDRALVLATLEADGDEEDAALEAIRDLAANAPPGITAAVGGRRRGRPRHLDDHRGRPRPGRADRHPAHADPAAVRLPRPRRGVAAVVRRRRRRARHVPVAVRHRLAHRRVGVRHQPDHRPRARAGDRLQPVHRLPLPRGAAGRTQRRRRRRPLGRDGRAHGGDQRPDRRRVAGRPARVPAVLPALVRLRRHRRRAAGDGDVDRRPAGAADRRRHPHRPAAHLPAPGPEARARALLVPQRPPRHAPAAAGERRRHRRPAAARLAVPAGQLRPTRRPGAADERAVAHRQRPAARRVRRQRGRDVPGRRRRRDGRRPARGRRAGGVDRRPRRRRPRRRTVHVR